MCTIALVSPLKKKNTACLNYQNLSSVVIYLSKVDNFDPEMDATPHTIYHHEPLIISTHKGSSW